MADNMVFSTQNPTGLGEKRPRSRKSIGYLPSPDDGAAAFGNENMGVEATTALDLRPSDTRANSLSKRSRSRSIGPGGLDALREDAGNRRKAAAIAAPKSILKPSIPLSPLKDIPARRSSATSRQLKSPSRSPQKVATTPEKNSIFKRMAEKGMESSPVKAETMSPTKVQLQIADIEEKGQSAGSDFAEDEAKKARSEALKQRDIRRKSMANRRVSFAPEATLHTWDMVEEVQDSTTSSASTNANRRASSISEASVVMSPNPRQSPYEQSSVTDDPPSTPPLQAEEEVVAESPANQRNLHQKQRRRRSSVIPPMNFNNPDDVFSSPYDSDSGSEAEASPISNATATNAHIGNSVGNLSPVRGSAFDNEDASISADELGEATMELANDEVTAAFQPWSQRLFNGDHPAVKLQSSQEHENTNPFSPAFKNATGAPYSALDEDGEISMDITRAIGSIAGEPKHQAYGLSHLRKSPSLRRSIRNRRRSSGASTSMEDASMELTTAIGAIQHHDIDPVDVSSLDTNEELSMEFTSVFGGIHNRKDVQPSFQSQAQMSTVDDLPKADVVPVGDSLLPFQSALDAAGDMDLTTAFGVIIRSPLKQRSAQQEEDETDMDMSTVQVQGSRDFAHASQDLIPGMVLRRSPYREQAHVKVQSSPSAINTATQEKKNTGRPFASDSVRRLATPVKVPQTPTKQTTPRTPQPSTPGKTPPVKQITTSIPSPAKSFQNEVDAKTLNQVSATASRLRTSAFQLTPKEVLTPRTRLQRRASGIRINKEGLGSPRVALLLDRRRSIGENAAPFSPSAADGRAVRFDNPRVLDEEVTRTRDEDERRESGQYILEQEVEAEQEDKDATTTLKEAIVSMTPKRKRLGGRKSLAVGAARGLLGVRPAELDESDEDRTPRAIRSAHASPVKRIKLSGPSPGRKTVNATAMHRPSLASIPANAALHTPSTNSPSKTKTITTPKSQGRFKDAENLPDARLPLPTLVHQSFEATTVAGKEEGHQKIHLREFLNLTSIRFIEINTTKRRHTIAPQASQAALVGLDPEGDRTDSGKALEESVVAGACTVALLELFQHACKELKKDIAGGRDLIREIEAETYRDNPALFREYMSAAPADRAIMDQQFKNTKTHARLLSKGMWYEWRMKLLEGLKEGLNVTAAEFHADNDILARQEQVLEHVLPEALEEHAALTQECAILRARADEIASYDQEELRMAQQELLALDEEARAKTQLTEDYERGFRDLDSAIEHAHEKRVDYIQSIREAHKLREEHRGWSAMEVHKLMASVNELEAKHGWTITSATSSTLTMAYRHQVQIFFNAGSFLPAAAMSTSRLENSPISLIHIGDTEQQHPKSLTTEKRFFLQLMRAHLQCLVQHQTTIKDLLCFVREGWDKALEVSEEIFKLDAEFITHCSILSDERLGVKAMMLLPGLKTKVHVDFEIGAVGKGGEVEMGLTVKAKVMYGEKYKEDRMADFLMTKVGRGDVHARVRWVAAVRELKQKLIAQRKKQ